jgi:hypothetical protein
MSKELLSIQESLEDKLRFYILTQPYKSVPTEEFISELLRFITKDGTIQFVKKGRSK